MDNNHQSGASGRGVRSTLSSELWLTSFSLAETEPLPDHTESHAGPYGVEVPLQWEYIVTVAHIKIVAEADHSDKDIQVSPQGAEAYDKAEGRTK